MLGFIQRWFMNEHQLALTDPRQYDAPVKAADIQQEITAARLFHEAREGMEGALRDATDARGMVSIARVVDNLQSIEDAQRWNTDRSLEEVAILGRLGAQFLIGHLTRRANALSAGILPGAADALR